MSTEICKLCNEECTPWFHINGHICQDCYKNSIERKLKMKRPEFTPEQEKWLCDILDDWYFCFNKAIIDNPNSLGYWKELLKLRWCDNPIPKDEDIMEFTA